MFRKPTLNDIAPWAALPMAHTSRLEGRLTMILDNTRPRRALTRRALLLALGAGVAALTPLAMLQPVARAQATPSIVPPGASTPEDVAAATRHLRQIYADIGVYRRTHGGAFPATFGPNCLAADMVVTPRRYGLPDRGTGNSEQAGRFFTSPGDLSVAYFLHNKRPDGTLKGTAKGAGTRDVFAYTDLYVRNHPKGAAGFYLVLWDDGTVGKVPAGMILAVRAYDVIGPPGATERARREGEKQVAFPGQAGLPRG